MREKKVQRARCYLLGETAVVLELEPPVTLESQKRIWGLTQRLTDHEEVVEVIPGMNNITVVLRRPQEMAWEAIDKLQRWWEESEALEPESREISIPVIYGGLPEQLAMPRRAEPRVLVPAGSVGIGGSQTGIYPLATPGGWQLLGRTPLALFDPKREEPVLLRSGDRVRFVPQKEGVC